MSDSVVRIDLKNYPALHRLRQRDPDAFIHVLKTTFTHVDDAIKEGHYDLAKDVYKMDYIEMMATVINTFFEFNGIVNQHHDIAEKEGLIALKEDMHPLAIFTNNVPVYDAGGRRVDPNKWLPLEQFDLKNWLYALFYGARFVSWKELAEYLTLGRFDLIEALQARNYEQLSRIQPALNYQNKQGITVGKLIEGTGYLECGSKYHELCPACEKGVVNHEHSRYSYCPKCSAGFRK